jgi:hypothetical protein
VHPNAQLIETLYGALARRDGAAMAACYARHARFKDPVFDLADAEIGAMWKMLCERATDLRVEWRDVTADASSGAAHLEAWYTFSATGRSVHNVIEAKFRFSEGRILKHRDRFNLWRWSRMALGARGALAGWTPMVQRKIRAQARRGLDLWIARHS